MGSATVEMYERIDAHEGGRKKEVPLIDGSENL